VNIAPLTAALNIILGGSLLLGGRKVFWLLLGSIGFITGFEAATRLLHRSELETILAALAAGLLFALIAIFLESVAIGLAGFMGGGYAAWSVSNLLGIQGGDLDLGAFTVGGIVGVVLIVLLLDWALISISSFAGASMAVGRLGLPPAIRTSVFGVLLFLGVLIQGLALHREAATRRAIKG
jgi:hypothetical protein